MNLEPRVPQSGLDQLAQSLTLDRRRPISEQIYAALRDSIVTLRLLPGSSISESNLCRSTGVSRTPVRAALQRLTEEGLIDVFPQQGSFVSLISLSTIRDSHFVRCALEVAMLKEARKHWTPATSAAAKSLVADYEAYIGDENINLRRESDERFHELFANIAGLQGAWVTVQAARARLNRFYRLFPERQSAVVAEHRSIIDALDAHEVELAVLRLESHHKKLFDLLEQLPDVYQPYLAE